ncbi:HAD family hydrolase [Haloferula sp. BvORR071]|uniref:HAD family hydrolase n=1 Tax=Haloferula sp. BvORR071 TaxID=1396141 RepID=UPI000552FB3C|nr:HAD family hydrolase [Haloferula sp. BvORR071]
MAIRAVLFDIYGTLLVSHAGGSHPDPQLRQAIARAHAASPYSFPEVDIREVYSELHPKLEPVEIEALALEQEHAFNPVSAMPGATETLQALSSAGMQLGLVSNAQFYTVPILEECLGASIMGLGIDPDLCQFSYLLRRAKPDLFVFETARDTLARRGISAAETLYVGNDVLKDIDPARSVGFRTALLAGDPQMLRLHGRNLADSGANWLLNDLREIIAGVAQL